MKLKRVMTFDLGTHCGWSTLLDGWINSGTQTFDLKRGESPGMRYIRFNAFLEELFNLIQPEMVAYEMAHHRGGFATELLLGMVTRVQEVCARHEVPYTSVHSATLKKHITGSGRGEKQQVIDAVSKVFGFVPKDDNEADALAILSWVDKEYGTEYEWSKTKPNT